MLKETLELLRKIETGIKHRASISILPNNHGLALQASIVCKKDQQRYVFQHVFSGEEIANIVSDTTLVDKFIRLANSRFAEAYGESIYVKKK